MPVPATFEVTPVLAIVTAPEPLYEVPLNPVPIVKVAKLLPKAIPEIVLLVNLALATLAFTKLDPFKDPVKALVYIDPVTCKSPGILTVVPSSIIWDDVT